MVLVCVLTFLLIKLIARSRCRHNYGLIHTSDSLCDYEKVLGPFKNLFRMHRNSRMSYIRQDNIFTSVCQKFCPRGASASVHAGIHPPGRHHLLPLGRHPPPQQTATAADGTHPTGMHSWFINSFFFAIPSTFAVATQSQKIVISVNKP